MAQINLPIPTTQFERDLVLQLTTYLRDINNKLQAQTGYLWNAPHPIMGSYHLWIDATGDLRIKNGTPLSELDGVVVGAQS